MAWLTEKAKNLLARGKGAETDPSAGAGIPSGAKTTYHDTKIFMPMESGRLTPLDGALEQMQSDPEVREVLERAGVTGLTREQFAEEAVTGSPRQRGQEITDDEHRLLNVVVVLGNGDAKFHGGYYTSAEAAYREAHKAATGIRDKSLQAVCLSVLAAAVAMQDKHEQALKHVEDALRRKPDLAEAWYNKGVVLLLLFQFSEALASFEEALQCRPVFTEARYNKGITLGNLGRYAEALLCFEETLEDDPQDSEAWLGKGGALLMLARFSEAVDSFEEALSYDKGSSGAWLGTGLGLMMLGRPEEAMTCFDEALSRGPEFAEAWLGKGQALGDLGQHKAAADCFEKAIGYKPDSAHAWHNKGVALEKLGLFKQALTAYERAQALEKGQR